MAISDKDFQDLRDKVNSGFQTQDTVVLPALTEIRDSIGKLAFVSQKDHDRDIRDVRKELKNAIDDVRAEFKPTIDQVEKDTKLVNAGGVKASNTLSSGVGKMIFAALILAIFGAIIYFGILISPALGALRP